MKTALLICFTYRRNIHGESKISTLSGTHNDIRMMSIFCKERGIPPENITIITDVSEVCSETEGCNIRFLMYPTPQFFCRELAQFVENTSRGIEDECHKGDGNMPEILIYISGHGSQINITVPEERQEQAMVLLENEGNSLRYLTTKDIFNILFGRIHIEHDGLMRVPIYSKTISRVPINSSVSNKYENQEQSNMEYILVYLSPTIQSPTSPSLISKPYRSTYLANRGLPPWSRVLIVVDTCHSAHMTHFPYIYFPDEQKMNPVSSMDEFVDHVDMPYCISISSCEIDKVTKSPCEGSHLTQVIFSQLMGITTSLDFRQFYYYVVNSSNRKIKSYYRKNTLTPVLSSTCNDVERHVPFFNDITINERPRRIIKGKMPTEKEN